MSPAPLAGRRALVTGAGRRTGRALALALAGAGADVAVHYRSRPEEADAVVAELNALGRRTVAVQAELADAQATERAVREATESLGTLDILINNVGSIVWKDLDDLTPEDWRSSLDGTLTATYHASRSVLPGMRAQGFGRIVNILDADTRAAPLHATPYKIGKAGTWLLTQALAKNEAPHGITVNAVSPGVLDDSAKSVPLERIPMGRVGTAEDVNAAVLFLVGPHAGYITGTNLKVSGGYGI